MTKPRHYIQWIAFAVAATACGSDTGHARIDFDVEMAGLGGGAPLANEHGWQVTITEAKLHLGALYFFEGEPLFARVWRELFTIPSAYAHPGHYVEGEALADLLRANTIDLLGPAVMAGRAEGVTGPYNSARVTLAPSSELENHTARIAGTATKGGTTIAWSGAVDLDEAIEGVAFGADIEAADGYVHLDIDLAEWVKRIDFDLVADGSVLTPGTQPHNALLRGVNNTSAFRFNWVANQ